MKLKDNRYLLIVIFIFFISSHSVSMSVRKPMLIDFKKNVFSQWGEDGIIEKIFEIIGTTTKVAVEFGAYDGFMLSNTANLWSKDLGWKGILIEVDEQSFNIMLKNVASYNCIPVCKKIGITGENSLENVLKELNIEDTIDILSIDIDGDDIYIFQSLQTIRPRVIICEYNPSIPAHLDVYTEPQGRLGCSVAALQRVGEQKGYHLVAITDTNCFFVRDDEFSKFAKYDTDREHIRIDRYIQYIISDYQSCYQTIASDDFRSPWGWNGLLSTEKYYGNLSVIKSVISQ